MGDPLLRTRGGISRLRSLDTVIEPSSPHTRRYFPFEIAAYVVGLLFSAHAEVFPGSTKESSDLEAVLANLQKAGVFTLLLQVGASKVGAVESAKIVDCGLLAEDMVATLEEEILAAYKADLYL